MLNFLAEGENKLTFLEKVLQDIFGSAYAMTVEIGISLFVSFFLTAVFMRMLSFNQQTQTQNKQWIKAIFANIIIFFVMINAVVFVASKFKF